MDKAPANVGSVGKRVGQNVKYLRGRLKQGEVVERLAELGVPMLKTTLSKIENGQRSVTTDELVALAAALNVTPNRLLLTGDAGNEEIDLTAGCSQTAWHAWQWAQGDRPAFSDADFDGLDGYSRDLMRSFNDNALPLQLQRRGEPTFLQAARDLAERVAAYRASPSEAKRMAVVHGIGVLEALVRDLQQETQSEGTTETSEARPR